jgi:hypothetical protein
MSPLMGSWKANWNPLWSLRACAMAYRTYLTCEFNSLFWLDAILAQNIVKDIRLAVLPRFHISTKGRSTESGRTGGPIDNKDIARFASSEDGSNRKSTAKNRSCDYQGCRKNHFRSLSLRAPHLPAPSPYQTFPRDDHPGEHPGVSDRSRSQHSLASATRPPATTYTAAAGAWRSAPRSVAMRADQDQHFADRDQDLSYERDHGGLLPWPAAAWRSPLLVGRAHHPLLRGCGMWTMHPQRGLDFRWAHSGKSGVAALNRLRGACSRALIEGGG